jgi:hypothetical protein
MRDVSSHEREAALAATALLGREPFAYLDAVRVLRVTLFVYKRCHNATNVVWLVLVLWEQVDRVACGRRQRSGPSDLIEQWAAPAACWEPPMRASHRLSCLCAMRARQSWHTPRDGRAMPHGGEIVARLAHSTRTHPCDTPLHSE